MTQAVTVTLPSEVVNRLEMLKGDKDVSYVEIISRVLDVADDADILCYEDVLSLKHGLDDVRAGRLHSSEEVYEILTSDGE